MDKRVYSTTIQHIFNQVAEEFDGEVSQSQIKDIYDCVWKCVHHYSNLNSLVKIIIPKFGSLKPSTKLVDRLRRRGHNVDILDK